ncbi:pilus assembly protein TadG-related protein [Bradyrhizobium sp. AUGA SZCCT0182]|uniref:pilus assembly protein TadG-related protein n=1 Tax=Bradyrhizobium sp. AUGA SZCCT0182 TaxID=2807667 RepID=UPI001BAB4033|nr:pilus assembly protein TadG-related protein [Bradyrhizobium sp. AUGA SZCCT0182]MBR1232839.1 hypothetical protein [Bradyrhizobium sp. AUGA SZCCT0182]
MRSLLRSRRGSVAFATVIALVPLIGVVALGGEAGSWYVTRQHAQNAADAAAYSGAVQELCLSGSSCAVSQSVDYRAKQAAAQNAFCNAGSSYPGSKCGTSPAGVSHSVQVASLGSWKGIAGTYIQATVSQQQPAYLARVLGLSTVNIAATAVAKVQILEKPPCVLALTGSVSFQGSPNVNAPNCGMASNSTAKDAINFTGGGMTMNLGSLSSVGGCTGGASFCNTALTYMPAPIPNPFSALDAVTIPTLAKCSGSALTAYSAATPCRNDKFKLTGNASGSPAPLTGGVYFISDTFTLSGGVSISGTALFILLPGASLKVTGNSSLNLTGNPSVAASQLPSALQSYASLFAHMALYKIPDPDTSKNGPNDVQLGGTSGIELKGIMYLPSANVTFQGNPTLDVTGGKCGELISKSVAFNGNATFDTTGCPSQTKLVSSQYVQLVQ